MSWRRAALDERLEILKEQLHEQLSREDGGLLDWLEHQIRELMAVAACSDHGDYVSKETGRVLEAAGYPGDSLSAAMPPIAMADPSAG
jgi:hypothetical protein